MKSSPRWAAGLTALAVTGAFAAAGCGSSSSDNSKSDGAASSSSSSTTASSSKSTSAAPDLAAALGTAKKATGTPVTLGLLNLESGPVTFPEYRQAAEAAAKYINDYKGGINGHPIKIVSCATDGQPATSARCANQVLDKKPVAILGGADTGAPGSFKDYQRANIAYLGGIPFTPVESNAPNAVEFISIGVGDNAAAVASAKASLGTKKASVLYTDDSAGKHTGLDIIAPAMKAAGIDAKTVPVSPTSADLSSVAASAVSSSPDLVYISVPNACPALLKAIKAVGSTAKLAGIDPCTSPQAIKTAGAAVEGLYFAQPFQSLDSGTKDANVMLAAVKKYGPADLALDSIAEAGFSSVMNIQAALDTVSPLNTKNILAAFKDGQSHPNFLAHPYTCDGKQLTGNTAICNTYQLMKQVKNGKVVTVDGKWLTGAEYYKPAA
jgi:branched-chain amino acid transport system substrate-binding protein